METASKTFRIVALSDENDHFARGFDVAADTDLADFNDFICSQLGFDSTIIASFFTSDPEWNKLREYTRFDMGMGDGSTLHMAGTSVGQVVDAAHDRLIYLFDQLNDRALYMEVTDVRKKDPGAVYPVCILSQGEAPGQVRQLQNSDAHSSIFDDAMDEFGDFEGDDSYDDM